MGELKEKTTRKERETLRAIVPKPDNKSMQPDGTWVSIDYTAKIMRNNAPKDITMLDAQKNANAQETKKEKGRLLEKNR